MGKGFSMKITNSNDKPIYIKFEGTADLNIDSKASVELEVSESSEIQIEGDHLVAVNIERP